MTPTFATNLSVSGVPLGEVASAFQKSIRRGMEDDALHWGVELDLSGYGEYAWKRMRIICSEDVGLAEPQMPAQIFALYQNWIAVGKKKDTRNKPERLFFIHAILLLVRAQKSRIVDHSLIVYYNNHAKRSVPDYALDKHTQRGRAMGRGFDHFFKEGIRLANEANIPDLYRERAEATMNKNKQLTIDEE